ncbi:DEAD/DEAH box helicase [Acidianus sulfidivorans JP7]|uniref:ATP-dependent helicase n=1 Tax=Acidianus sulfidivorans JP7 TaxID=619593 RepID=A0A2U9IPA6_9CREN|nr:DEAD/DEAH box helicase [Acidianus sulfidivorans]AWR97817.1 DEAD/DEAH box helicase [Acidianus sulfidivorans JP7]
MMSLNQRLLELMKERKWKGMTEVQEKALKPILDGKNTLIIAPTGFGKTEAALLPVLSSMLEDNVKPVAVLYITPLKALINDLTLRIDWWASRLNFYVNRKHGEVPQKEKNLRLKRVPHILVTTPEGLEIDLDWATKFRENYKNVKWVIVDEIHELIGSKRGVQLSVLLERLKDFSNYDFQRIGLSATVGDEDLVSSFLFGSSNRESEIVKINDRKEFQLKVVKLNSNSDVWKDAAKYIVSSTEKPTLIFTNSRFLTERLHEELEQYSKDFFVHHSSISREGKSLVEDNLRNGKAKGVICTKTLELGIDVGDIKKIIMFRPPSSVSSFLQRLGRSGHNVFGIAKGEIICLYDFDILEAYAIESLAKNGKVERTSICKPLDVASREILGIILQYGEIEKERVFKILTSSYPFRNLSEENFDELINYLSKNNLLTINNGKLSIGKFFFKLWNFNKNKNFTWSRNFSEFFSLINNNDTFLLRWGDKNIGEIDAIYVYKHIRSGDTIRIGGKLWKITKINTNSMSIDVTPSDGGEGEIPVWKGDGISKSYLIPHEIEKLIKNNEYASNESVKRIIEKYKSRNLPLPSSKIIMVTKNEKETIYSTLINEKISNTIAHMLLYLATAKDSLNSYARYSIYGFSVSFTDKDLLKEILQLDDKKLRKIIIRSILRSPLFISTLKEIQISFGKVGKVDKKEDIILIKEALRQTVSKYFSIKKTLQYIKMIRDGKIKIINCDCSLPLEEAVLMQAPIKPWINNITSIIYETLKGGAYTVNELSELIGVSAKSIEIKLKQMRKPESKYRIVSFIDVDNREVRWCKLDELEQIVQSCDFYTSFNAINDNETFIASLRALNSSTTTELIFKPKEILSNIDEIRRRIPFEEIGELRIYDPVDPLVYNISPRFYYINKKVAPYILLNAVAYVQNMKYS